MKFQYIFSAIARWQVFSYYSDILLQWTSITFALSYHDTTLLCWTTYASETVGLSQTQEHAVIKDAELKKTPTEVLKKLEDFRNRIL